MGLILQRQRRAIESLHKFAREWIEIGNTKLLASRRLWVLESEGFLVPLGVSRGEGTCSDIFGMNVLVLSQTQYNKIETLIFCDYAVLLDTPTEADRIAAGIGEGTALACVELLQPLVTVDHLIYFTRTGRRAAYVPL